MIKPIKMSELDVGDIYAYDLKLNGREAFIVTDIKQRKTTDDHYLQVKSRKTGKLHDKSIYGNVYLLRSKNEKSL